ncbi:MAG: NADH dehydrogenase (quinone) subunit D [Deltaproteobacteria bacterium]|nr:NADH dehydrogenase (quinone) subunit D [Deltaproteobacteria bacterium]
MEYHFQLVQQLKEKIGADSILREEKSNWNPNEYILTVRAADIRKICEFLKKQKGFLWMMDICGVHYPEREENFEAVYHLYNKDNNKRIRLKVPHKEGTKIPSITSVYKAANWFEREAYDMMGIFFEGHPSLTRILCHHKFVGHPLRKNYSATANQVLDAPEVFEFPPMPPPHNDHEDILTNQRTVLNIGPSHPATHGTFRWFVELEGETIIRSKAEIGYLHRCFEKMAETHKYQQLLPYTDRLNYLSAPMNNSGYCQAVERMLGVTIPLRAQYIRVILNELSRVIDHLVCIGTTAVDMGALTTFWFCFRQRENVYELFEKLCGNRMLTSITRIGGVYGDLDEDWKRQCRGVLVTLRETVEEVDKLLSNNKIWLNRMKDTGVVSKEMAVDYAFTGPCGRASGIDYDIRKAEPYYDYDKFDFDVPVSTDGDNFARYYLRLEEMRQSIRIVEQALNKLPDGPTTISNPLVVLPPKSEVYSNIEALMNHFMLVIEGIKPPKGEIYSYSEAANGELGFYIVSDGTGYPYRVKVRPPCFPIYSSFEDVVQGGLIADAVATLGQFNVIAGELDR